VAHPGTVSMRKVREWACRGHVIEASFKVGACPRLAESCAGGGASQAEVIDTRWSFRQGLEGFPLIRLKASGALQLECKRCLSPVAWPVEVDCRLTAVGSESEIREVASPYDTVVGGPDGLLLRTILEDEILTSLPMAPMHSHCAGARPARFEVAPGASRPLAGLGALMRQSRD